jgi:hypothetical protein
MLTPGVDEDPLADGVWVTPAALERVARNQVQLVQGLRWASGVDPAAATRRFVAAFPGSVSAYAAPRPPSEVVNLSRVGSLPQAFGAFLAFVGVAGLLHALVTSARRRRHDLAVLRALGFLRRQLGASVAWQSTTITVFGLLAGLPLGIAVGRWVWIVVAEGVGVASDPLVPVLAAVLLVPAALVVSNLVAAPLGMRASRIPPATVLRTE